MTSNVSAEKAALEDLMESGILDRSQNLQKLLLYICQKHFDGDGDRVKEYTIATEALGRPPEFDQKKDSIVRVEIHRLRKRLAQYYAEEGKDKPVQIVIPEGKYHPQFLFREKALEPARETEPALHARPLPPATPIPATPHRARNWVLALGGAAILMTALAGMFVLRARIDPKSPAPDLAAVIPTSTQGELRILAGRATDFLDSRGDTWTADRFFRGGTVNATPHPPVDGTGDPDLFATQREGEFDYDIPLAPGSYELRLYFAETVVGEGNPAGGAESSRLFHLAANGVSLLEWFDVLADAPGPRMADIRVFKDIRPADDGKLHLSFRPGQGSAFVNAIEIRRTPPGRIRPVRLVAQSRPVRDAFDRPWLPDGYVRGGNVVKRHRAPDGAESPDIFRGERYGTFAYSIPVAVNGVYRVSLYFHESWFGPDYNGKGGAGSRLFNVHINHQPILENFDLFKVAGGAGRPFIKTVHGIRSNARGKLVIEFEPLRNYACVNAIDVEDESPVPNR